ncbi:acetyl-CoA carboxylase biotin carboxyl carrier protein subunit [Candidatus Woesearchaeota archaeon]|nr:acetyl-CoA carboxylase biotin carboxyl carrier protein subunit [Candidatus Woesearchaeota archaeon]
MEDLTIKVDGKEYNVKVEETNEGKLKIHCDGDVYEVEAKEKVVQELENELGKKEGAKESKGIVTAPLPGIIFSVDVKKGDKVKKGKRLLTLMAMKMENEIVSPKDGAVKDIQVKKNDSVDKGDVLIVIE